MSDQDFHANSVITVEPPGKYPAVEAFGLIALSAEFEPRLFREHVRAVLASPALPEESRLVLIRGLAAMAEAGQRCGRP